MFAKNYGCLLKFTNIRSSFPKDDRNTLTSYQLSGIFTGCFSWTTIVLGKPSNEKTGNSLVFYQTGGGGRYPKTKLFLCFFTEFFLLL